jgi:hypothetical protein
MSPLRTLLLITVAATAGCGAGIGDSCTTNVECSSLGDRICDTSQVEGYCTVEGCDLKTCPSGAVCVRFFPAEFLSTPCDPSTEDSVDVTVKATNDCATTEVCLSSGFCALRTAERRFCMRGCSDDAHCRSGYECRKTGSRGAEAVRDPVKSGPQEVRFCAQRS